MASTKSRRTRPQSSPRQPFSARIVSCGVANVNGSYRTVERRSAGNGEMMQRWIGKQFLLTSTVACFSDGLSVCFRVLYTPVHASMESEQTAKR